MQLREFRDKNNITQQDVASWVGKDVTTICKYENLDIKPSIVAVSMITKATDGAVTLDDFLTEEEKYKVLKVRPMV